jgi:PAS domain S-box-containing protein
MKSLNVSIFRKLVVFSIPVFALYIISRDYYLLFHSIVEIYAIVIAASVFVLAWNTYYDLKNGFFGIIGIGFLFVAIVDLFHTFTYKGVNILPIESANLATQLWITARYLEIIGLVAAIIFVKKVYNKYNVLICFTLLLLGIFVLFLYDLVPACYVEGKGLTTFKITSEYLIVAVLLGVLIYLNKRKKIFYREAKVYFSYALIFTALSELSFTLYADVYGLFNMTGHLFKAFSFYMVYLTFIKEAYEHPFSVLKEEKKDIERRYKFLFDSGSDAVFVHRLDTEKYIPLKFIEVNEEGCKMLGYTRDEILDLGPVEIQNLGKPVKHDEITKTLVDEGNIIFQNEFVTKNGSVVPVEVNAKLFDNDLVYSSVRDITRRLEKQKEILYNERLLAQQSKLSLLGEMIGTIAHQWKQPLNSIFLACQYLKRIDLSQKDASEDVKKIGEQVSSSVQFLNETIDNFRDFIKTKDSSENFNLLSSILDTYKIYSPQFHEDNIHVEVHCNISEMYPKKSHDIFTNNIILYGCDVDNCRNCSVDIVNMHGSENEFKNIMVNLISNAKDAIVRNKNIENGFIKTEVYTDENNLYLTVEDNGGGIPENIQDKIFDKYFTTKGKKGTGIGLYVAKDILKKMFDSEISFENTGYGARFIISIPLAN